MAMKPKAPTLQEDIKALRVIADRMLSRLATAAVNDARDAAEKCEDSLNMVGPCNADEYLYVGRAIHLIAFRAEGCDDVPMTVVGA